MRHSPIPRSNSNVLELYVHIVFGFEKFAPIDLAGGDFEGNDVALCFVEEFDGDANGGSEFAHGGPGVIYEGALVWLNSITVSPQV